MSKPPTAITSDPACSAWQWRDCREALWLWLSWSWLPMSSPGPVCWPDGSHHTPPFWGQTGRSNDRREGGAQTSPIRGRSQDVVKGHALPWELRCAPLSYCLATAFEVPFLKREEYQLWRTVGTSGKLSFDYFLVTYKRRVCIYSVQHIY